MEPTNESPTSVTNYFHSGHARHATIFVLCTRRIQCKHPAAIAMAYGERGFLRLAFVRPRQGSFSFCFVQKVHSEYSTYRVSFESFRKERAMILIFYIWCRTHSAIEL